MHSPVRRRTTNAALGLPVRKLSHGRDPAIVKLGVADLIYKECLRAMDKIGYVSNVYIAGVMCMTIQGVTGRPVQYCLRNERGRSQWPIPTDCIH